MATQESLILAQQAYIAYYGRPADPAGLEFWANRIDAEGLMPIINAFGNSAEADMLYGGLSDEETVNTLYQQIFGRDADPEGLAFYTGELASGNMTLATIALDIYYGAQGDDLVILDNRLQVAQNFTAALDTDEEVAAYAGDAAAGAARDMLSTVDFFTNPDTFYAIDNVIAGMVGGTVTNRFILQDQFEGGTPASPVVTTLYWGYDPDEAGIPASDLLDFLSGIAGVDLTELGLIDDNGQGAFEGVTQLSLGDVFQTGDGSTGTLEVTFDDGSSTSAEVVIAGQYMDFLRDLLFDADGNSRLYEVTTGGDGGSPPQRIPTVLTPNQNNGGTTQPGFTTPSDDLIVAGRLDLLHGATIDGGGGFNILEVDAKGSYAQPLDIANVQEIRVQNLPNIYGEGSSEYPNTTDSDSGGASVLDLSRATDIEQLVVAEGFGSGTALGDLVVIGIRNGADLRLEGGFTEGVTLHFGEGIGTGGINLALNLGDTYSENFDLAVSHSSSTLNISAEGGENWIHDANLGGQLRFLNITGEGSLTIEGNVADSFIDTRVAVIDASNGGGVSLTLDGQPRIEFSGSEAGDEVSATGGEEATITGGGGDNRFHVDGTETVELTAGDGDNEVSADGAGEVDITLGGGDNEVTALDTESVSLVTGDGNNTLAVAADGAFVRSGAGNDELMLGSRSGESQVDVDLGGGENSITVSDLVALDGSSIGGDSASLFVAGDSDLSRAMLPGVDSAVLNAGLTLMADQFAALGATGVSVFRASFGETQNLHLIVTEDTVLEDLVDIDALSRAVRLNIDLRQGATLTLSAQTLHENVAWEGIDSSDGLNGQVVITGAGANFDPFDSGDNYQSVDGGSLTGNFDSSTDVSIEYALGSGYNRPAPQPSTSTLTIDSDQVPVVDDVYDGVDDGVLMSLARTLEIIGTADIEFTVPVDLSDTGYRVDFEDLEGAITGLSLADFQDATSVRGNGDSTNSVRVDVQLSGEPDTDIVVGEPGEGGGFDSRGVQTYVITGITDNDGSFSDNETATFYVGDKTLDLEALGVQSNFNATVNFLQVNWGVDLLLEGDGRVNSGPQSLGHPAFSNVGAVNMEFAFAGATADITLSNQGVATDRPLNVPAINIANATSINLTVEDTDAIIGSINNGDFLDGRNNELEELTFTSANDVTVQGQIAVGNLSSVDASGVAGAFTLELSGDNDLSGVSLTGVDAIALVDEDASLTLTNAQLQAIGPAAVSGDGTLTVIVGDGTFDSTAVAGSLSLHVVVAPGTYTLDPATDLSAIDSVVIGSGVDVTLTAEQFLQLASADFTYDGTGSSVHITDVAQVHIDAGLEAILLGLSDAGLGGSISLVEDVTLTATTLNAAAQDGFTLLGDGTTRVNIVMDAANAGDGVNEVGTDPVNGIRSDGIASFIVTELDPNAEDTVFVCLDTVGLETVGLRGNEGDAVTIAGILRGTDILLEGDGAADWSDVEKTDPTPDHSTIGAVTADFFSPGATPLVTINNQGVELQTASDGSERYLLLEGLEINNAAAITLDVADGDAVIASLAADSATSLTLTATEDLHIQGMLPATVASLDATGVAGDFSAYFGDVAAPLDIETGASASLALDGVVALAGSSIDGSGGTLHLTVTDADLSNAALTGVDSLEITEGSSLTLTAAQYVTIGGGAITGTDAGAGDAPEVLNLKGLTTQVVDVDDFGAGVVIGTVLLGGGNYALNSATDLTGAVVTVPSSAAVTMTADQYMALADIDGLGTGATINITGLTQAHIDAGFSLAQVSGATGTVALAEDLRLVSTTDLNGFEVLMEDNQTFGIATRDQADGLAVTGGAGTVVEYLFASAGDPATVTIDASAYAIEELHLLDVLVSAYDVELIQDLPSAVTVVIYDDPNLLAFADQTFRMVAFEEGVEVDNFILFNGFQADQEVATLDITFRGDNAINGHLNLSAVEPDGGDGEPAFIKQYLQAVFITSEGPGPNTILGDIDPRVGTLAMAQGLTAVENNLLNLTINATQDFSIGGKILFNARGDDLAGTFDDETATLNVSVAAGSSVDINDVDTGDDDVTALVVNHTGSGALTIGLSTVATIDDGDALTINGSAGGMTTLCLDSYDETTSTAGPPVDLTDDTLVNVDAIILKDGTELILTGAQLTDLGGFPAISVEGVGATATVDIVGLGSFLFDASGATPGIDVGDVTISGPGPVVTLNPMTDLTGVDRLVVPEGLTLRLTAAQFKQLDGDGVIVGETVTGAPSTDYEVHILGLTQADVDTGGPFDITGITADAVTLTLAEDVNLLDDSQLGDVARLTVTLMGGQELGLANAEQASGLSVDGTPTTTLTLLFDDTGLPPSGNVGTIDASGFDVGTLKALNTFVDGRSIENVLVNLASEVTLSVFQSPDDLGFVGSTDRIVIIEPGVTVPDFIVVNDWATDREVRNLDLTLAGGAEIDGDLRLSTVEADSNLIPRYFDTLTIVSEGTDANLFTGRTENIIRGSITAEAMGPPEIENNLRFVEITATQELIIEGDIVFTSVDAERFKTAEITISSDTTEDVTVQQLDMSDNELSALTIRNFGTGTFTATGASPAIFDGDDDGQYIVDTVPNLQALFFVGQGDIVLGTKGSAISGANLSEIVADDLDGDLHIGEVTDIDSESFAFRSGTGVTTLELTTDTLEAEGFSIGWIFDYVDADVGSILEFGDGISWVSGDLDLRMGDNGTLLITGDNDLSDLNLSFSGVQDIIVADGATLTLSAKQANDITSGVGGVNIVGESGAASTGIVNIVDFGDYDDAAPEDYIFTNISPDVAGTITLFDSDVTVGDATLFGAFSITLNALSGDNDDLSGETIRFQTEEQAEREIIVNAPDGDTDNTNSTNVVWLHETYTDALDTSGYDANLGRLWLNPALVADVAGNIETLYTTLPESIVRIEFSSLTDLDALLLASEVNRVLELVAFTDTSATGLRITDPDDLEYVRSLTLELGGEVNVGNITIGDDEGDPLVDLDAIVFETLTINSYRALSSENPFASEQFVNDNDGVNEFIDGEAENVQPQNMNMVGAITVATLAPGNMPGVGLLDVRLNTGDVSVVGDSSPGAGADLMVERISFDADGEADSTATLMVSGANTTTVDTIDATDPDITTVAITNAGPGTLLAPGASAGILADGSPVSNDTAGLISGTETLTIDAEGPVILGTEGDLMKPGIASNELSLVDVGGSSEVDLGVIGTVDPNDFTLDAIDNTGVVSAVLTEDTWDNSPLTLNNAGTWLFTNEGSTGELNITLDGSVGLFNAGSLTFNNVGLTISGTVDLTTLADLTLIDTPIEVPAGATLNILAEDADGLTITGDGVVNVFALEDALDADLSGIFTTDGDLGDLNAEVLAALGETLEFTGDLGRADVSVTGQGTFDITEGEIDSDPFDNDDDPLTPDEVVQATFDLTNPNGTLVMTANQADGHSVTGAGTTEVEDLGLLDDASDSDVDLSGVLSAFVEIAVDSDVTLNSEADLGPAGPSRVTTVGEDATLEAPGSVVDAQYIDGAGTLLVDDENDNGNDDVAPADTAITADLSNVDAAFVTLVKDAVLGTATFPSLEFLAAPTEGQVLTMTTDQFEAWQDATSGAGLITSTSPGVGELRLTHFDNDNALIDVANDVSNVIGTFILDPAAAAVVLDPTADIDSIPNAGDSTSFGFEFSADGQRLALSSEIQADGRVVDGMMFDDTVLALAFLEADPVDADGNAETDANLEAGGFDVENIWMVSEYLFNEFSLANLPANIETILPDLRDVASNGDNVVVTLYDAATLIDGGLIDPDGLELTDRFVVVNEETTVDATIAFNDITSDSEVSSLDLTLEGASVITGNLTLEQNADPLVTLMTDGKLPGLFKSLVINSVDVTGTASGPNEIRGSIYADDDTDGPASESFAETFELMLDAGTLISGNEDSIAFDGSFIILDDGDDASDIAAKLANASYENWTAETHGGGTVVFTYKIPGDLADPTFGDFTFENNGGSANFPGVSGVAVTQQGVFQAQENNLHDITINADHELIITGELELSYVTRSNVLKSDTVVGTITINGDADVTIGSVNTDDLHVSGVLLQHNGTGTVWAPGTTPGASVQSTGTATFNTDGTINLGTEGDDDKPGIAGADLMALNINTDGSTGTVNVGVIAEIAQDFTMTVGGGTATATLGVDSSSDGGTTQDGPDLIIGGTWSFIGTGADFTLTINEEPNFLGGTLALQDLTLVLEGTVDLSAPLVDLQLDGVMIEVPAGAKLVLRADQADGLMITGEGEVEVVGDELDSHDFSGLAVSIVDFSGLATAQNNDVVLDLSGNDNDSTVFGSSFDDTITTGAGVNTILGNAGNDTIDGGEGSDDIDGGADDDTVIYDANDASVDGGADNDTIDASGSPTGVTISLFDASDAFDNFENIIGSEFSDELAGNAADNTILGMGGDDDISMGIWLDSGDVIDGGDGFDSLTFIDSNAADDDLDGVTNVEQVSVSGTNSEITTLDSLVAAGETLIVSAVGVVGFFTFDGSAELDGDFDITGSGGADVLIGGNLSNSDIITGGPGDDFLTGNAGNDTFNVDEGNDTITDLAGGDDVVVSPGASATGYVVGDWTPSAATQNDGTGPVTLILGDIDPDGTVVDSDAFEDDGFTIDLSAVNAGGFGFELQTDGPLLDFTLIGSAFDDTLSIGSDGAIPTGDYFAVTASDSADFGDFGVVLEEGVGLFLSIDQFLATGPEGFSGTGPASTEELLVITDYRGEALDSSLLGPQVLIGGLVLAAEGTAAQPTEITIDPTADLSKVGVISIPEFVTLNMTAAQYEQMMGSVANNGFGTVAGFKIVSDLVNPAVGGTLNITDLSSSEASIDLGLVEDRVSAGTVSLSATETSVVLDSDAVLDTDPLNVSAGLDTSDDDAFTLLFTAEDQSLTLSSAEQADGRDVSGGDFDQSTLILGFTTPDSDGVLDADGYDVEDLWVLNEYLENLFRGGFTDAAYIPGSPLNIEAILPGLPDQTSDGNNVEVTVVDAATVLGGGLGDPDAIDTIDRFFTIDSNTTLDASVAFQGLDDGLPVRSVTLTMQGNSELTGSLSMPQDLDPAATLASDDELPTFLQSLTIISENETGDPGTDPNVFTFGGVFADDGTDGPLDSEAESFEYNIPGMVLVGGTIEFDGATINVAAGESQASVAAKLASASYVNWTAEVTGADNVRYTNKNAGEFADVVVGDFVQTGAAFGGAPAIVGYQQGVFLAEENNLYDITIQADHELIINGEVELRYVTRSNSVSSDTVEGVITVNGDADVTIGSVNSDDPHVSAAILQHNGTGTVIAPGTSPGAAVNATGSLVINTSGSVLLGSPGDPTKPGVAGDELSVIEINNDGSTGFVNLGNLADLNEGDFTLTVFGGSAEAILGAPNSTPGQDGPELNGGTWTFGEDGGELTLTITEETIFTAGTLIIGDGVELVLEGDIDISGITVEGFPDIIEIPAGSCFTVSAEQADGLVVTGEGCIKVVGHEMDSHDYSGLGVPTVDFSGLDSAQGWDVVIDLSGYDDIDFTVTGSRFDDTITTGAGADSIFGGEGEDFIDAGAGADTIVAGEDADTVVYDSDDTSVNGDDSGSFGFGEDGGDTIDASAETMDLFIDLDNDPVYSNFENIIGGSGNDTLLGTGENPSTLDGGPGDDTLTGRDFFGFSNTFVVGEGSDTITDLEDFDALFVTGSASATANNIVSFTGGSAVNTSTGYVTLNAADGGAFIDMGPASGTAGYIINGGAGADFLGGSDFDDLISAGDEDTIDGEDGTDTVRFDDDVTSDLDDFDLVRVENVEITNASAGSYDFSPQTESLNILGGAADDTFFMGDQLDSADTVDGAGGFDTLVYSDDGVDPDSGELDGVSNVERIELFNMSTNVVITALNSLIAAGMNVEVDASSLTTGTLDFDGTAETDGSFTVIGGASDDTFIGGASDDTFTGGGGEDDFYVAAGTDTITDLTEDDFLQVSSGATAIANNVEFFQFPFVDPVNNGTAILNLVDSGGVVDLFFAGGTGGWIVNGGASDDLINGSENDDLLNGGGGDDFLSGEDGDDTINGDEGSDFIDGGLGDDDIDAGNGDDFVAYDPADTGIDSVDGGADTDTLFVGFGFGDVQIDLADTTDAFVNFENVYASAGNDTLRGDGNANVLLGDDGDDDLFGEGGNDFLIGSTDRDEMWGGSGADNFVFFGGDTLDFASDGDTAVDVTAADIIYDFNPAEDKVSLPDFASFGPGFYAVADGTSDDATSFLADAETAFGNGADVYLAYNIAFGGEREAWLAVDIDGDGQFANDGAVFGDVFVRLVGVETDDFLANGNIIGNSVPPDLGII